MILENKANKVKLHLVAKDKVRQLDGTETSIALFVDDDQDITVMGIKRPNDLWKCEVFRGSDTEDGPKTPVGKFSVRRVGTSTVERYTLLAIDEYEHRRAEGGQRLVYSVN